MWRLERTSRHSLFKQQEGLKCHGMVMLGLKSNCDGIKPPSLAVNIFACRVICPSVLILSWEAFYNHVSAVKRNPFHP